MIKEMRNRGCHIKDMPINWAAVAKPSAEPSRAPPPRKSGVSKSKLDDFKQTSNGCLAEDRRGSLERSSHLHPADPARRYRWQDPAAR